MNQSPLSWDLAPGKLDADPAALLAVGRSRWEAAGASFVEQTDEMGETVLFTTGQVKTNTDGVVPIGLVAYDDEETYLLVPPSASTEEAAAVRLRRAVAVLTALNATAGFSAADDVREVFGTGREPTLGERVELLEQSIAALATSLQARPGAPLAADERSGSEALGHVLDDLKGRAAAGFGSFSAVGRSRSGQYVAFTSGRHSDLWDDKLSFKWFETPDGFGFVTEKAGPPVEVVRVEEGEIVYFGRSRDKSPLSPPDRIKPRR